MSNQETLEAMKNDLKEVTGTAPKNINNQFTIAVDLPKRKEKREITVSSRINRRIADGIEEVEKKTGMTKSDVINHILEKGIPSLKDALIQKNPSTYSL